MGTTKAKPLDKKTITILEIAVSNTLEIEALILMEKETITKDELLGEIEKMRGKIRGR